MAPDRALSHGTRVFLRRIPDVQTLLGRRKCYEVGLFAPGRASAAEIRRTRTPGSLLRAAGVHTTDIWDVVHNADEAWAGGVGPWRGIFPDETP